MQLLALLLASAPQQCPMPIAVPGHTSDFGTRVAIDGDLAVFTDAQSTGGGTNGAAFFYRFEPITGQWNYEGPVHRAAQGFVDGTGLGVALDDDTLAVGSAWLQTTPGVIAGGVTLWEYDGSQWVEGPTVVPSIQVHEGRFGEALDLDGDRLVVGNNWTRWDENGLASLFERDASGTWSETAVIRPRTPSTALGFGYAVAFAGEQILVTAIEGVGHGPLTGAVIVFEEDPGTGEWIGVQRLSGSTAHAMFGRSLSVDGDRLAVGSWPRLDSVQGNTTRGAAFVFERDPATRRWSEVQRVGADSIQSVDQFGVQVALDGDSLSVAEWGAELYFFRRSGPGASYERVPYRAKQVAWSAPHLGLANTALAADAGHVLSVGWNSQTWDQGAWAMESAPAVDCDGDGFDDDCALALGWQLDENGDGHPDTCGGLGTRVCFGRENSLERPTRLAALGSARVTDADFRLRAMGMRPLWSGYFLVSDSTGFVPLAGGSLGNLCIAGPAMGRFSNQVQQASQAGTVEMPVDLAALPRPNGVAQVQPGDTWYFQFWHRDQRLGGGTTSTFSDAVGVTFE